MTAAEQGEAVLARAVAAYQEALGPRLIAAYALGSLAHGGFSPLVSDVDLGLILGDPLRAADRAAIRAVAEAVKSRPGLHERLSVFWGTPSTLAAQAAQAAGGRFPPLDRLDLLEYGRLLAGTDARRAVARPGPAELLVAGAEFALGYLGGAGSVAVTTTGPGPAPPADHGAGSEIREPARLVARGPRRLTKTILFPVRFMFTAATGRVGTNALAAGHYLAGPPAPAAELVSAALAWRQAPPADCGAAAALVGRELVPLYAQYLDDHIARLLAAGRPELAARFRQWRTRLIE
jgi:hypothetical protein